MKKIWKKAIALLFAAMVVFTGVNAGTIVADAKAPFSDVPYGEWYEAAVQYVYDNGIMSGSNGLFNPTKNVTRAQLVTTLYNMEGAPAVKDFSACNTFTDLSKDEWFAKAVCWACNVGVASGNKTTMKFNPNDSVTRQQLATFFYNYAKYKGYDTKTRGDYSSLLGADQVASYAADTMKWAYGTRLITGSKVGSAYDLKPTGTATRAQLASILQRFCEEVAKPEDTGVYHSITYRNLTEYGAEALEVGKYSEKEGLAELPQPTAAGYKFVGWYTKSAGGDVVDYIPAGSTQNYVLYARWELITYHIYYDKDTVPEHSNVETYTVEDRVILKDPKWSGLKFTGWYDKDGNQYTEIPKGTTGDIELTARWKLMRNIATPGENTLMLAKHDKTKDQYVFIYELGTLEHVVLEELSGSTPNLYNHTGAGDFTLSVENSLTLEESVADSIAKTISRSVSSSSEWEESKEWAKENSKEHNVNATIGVEFGTDACKASIEMGYGYTTGSTSSWGGSSTKGGSYGEETENGEEVSSSFSYLESLTTTTSTSITISGDSPEGYYSYVNAGNIRVFGVVVYDIKTGNLYLNTYSTLDNMHNMVLYYPDVNALNHPTCETLEYKIPRDDIFEKINNTYFVEYDANGGKGTMDDTMHSVGGEEQLSNNEFTREGYIFQNWEERYEDGTSKATYTDGQILRDIASNGDRVTLYAVWKPITYTIEYEGNKPTLGSTYVENLPAPTVCTYDEDVTLASAPTLLGYSFDGWWYNVTTKVDDVEKTEAVKLGNSGQTFEKANFKSEQDATINVYAKWIANTYNLNFDKDGDGVADDSKKITFDQLYGELPIPDLKDHIFQGWQRADKSMLGATEYVKKAEDEFVTAQWLRVSNKLYRRDDVVNPDELDIRINDDDAFYTELVNPQMNRQDLIAAGYTKIQVKWYFQLCEIDQGNQHIKFAPVYDPEGNFWEQKFNSTPSGWTSYSGTVEIDLESANIGENCEFYAAWDAYGNGGDDWWLGDTNFTITAIKGI